MCGRPNEDDISICERSRARCIPPEYRPWPAARWGQELTIARPMSSGHYLLQLNAARFSVWLSDNMYARYDDDALFVHRRRTVRVAAATIQCAHVHGHRYMRPLACACVDMLWTPPLNLEPPRLGPGVRDVALTALHPAPPRPKS